RRLAAVGAAGAACGSTDAQAVVGLGGYVSTPAYLAARRRGVPVVVHEANARPGLANRLGARFAARVAVTFPGTPLRGAVVTGMPMRGPVADLAGADEPQRVQARARAAAELGLDPARPTLVVTGGSLGAVSLNRAVAGAASAVLRTGAQVLHLTGTGKAEEVHAAVAALPAELADDYHVRE